MTDARFPERYLSDRRVTRLSSDEFRGWAFATLWSVSNRTDGVILEDEILLIPFMNEVIASKLVNRDLWDRTDSGWLIADFQKTQTSRNDLEVLEHARAADAAKKRRLRAAKKDLTTADGPRFADVPGTVGGMSPGRVPEDSTGEDRTGRDEGNWHVNEATGELTDTPEKGVGATDTPAPVPAAAWGSRSCVVCGAPIQVDHPVPWCGRQDEQHRNYMTAASAA